MQVEEQDRQEEAATDVLAAVMALESQALAALVDADVRAAAELLNDAGGRLDALLGGAGRYRLRHRLTSTSECARMLLDMFPYQIEALQLYYEADDEAAAQRLHGNASVCWRLAKYLFELAGEETTATGPLADVTPPPADDERAALVDALDGLLEEGGALTAASGTHALRMEARRERLWLHLAVAPLDARLRHRALSFFQRLGGPPGEWDELAIADDTFVFSADLGQNLDRAARLIQTLLHETLGEREPIRVES